MIYKFLNKREKNQFNELIKNPEVYYPLGLIEERLPQYAQLKGFSKSKLVSRLKEALNDSEKLLDFLAEIKVALLFVNKGVLTELEPLCGGKKPELLVHINKEKVYIEVKRIRKTEGEKTQEAQKWKIKDTIRKIPSPFYVDIFLGETLNPLILTDEVSNKIIKKITSTIHLLDQTEDYLNSKEFTLNDIQEELGSFTILRKESNFKGERTSCLISSEPINYSNEEYEKFKDDVVDKVSQLPKNEIGLIFFWVDSNVHEEIDLENPTIFIYQTSDGLKQHTEFQLDKLFQDYHKLSGVTYRSNWVRTQPGSKHCYLYVNPWADRKINRNLLEALADYLD